MALPSRGDTLDGPTPIQIIVLAEQPVISRGLSVLLEAQPDFRVLGEPSHGMAAVQLARETGAEVLLVDWPLSGCSGLDVLQALRHEDVPSACRPILLSGDISRAEILGLLRRGVCGVMKKTSPVDLIFKCIRRVCTGEIWIGRHVTADLVTALSGVSEDEPVTRQDIRLTPREREILRLVVEAESNKRIAERLSITTDTVKHHLTSIFDKTGASSRLELLLFTLRHHYDR